MQIRSASTSDETARISSTTLQRRLVRGRTVQLGADLILMAMRGENELRHALIGSTALGVLARNPIPVVLVQAGAASRPAPAESGGPPRLLVAYNGTAASRAALAPSGHIARATDGELILVWIHQNLRLDAALEPDAEKRERRLAQIEAEMTNELERLASGLSCRFRVIVRPLTNQRWSTVDEIRAIASEENADMICMTTRGHSAVYHLLFGSTALEMVGRSEVPVMFVRAETTS